MKKMDGQDGQIETRENYTYEAVGDVRGGCGHAHRTPETAWRCVQRDGAAISRLPGQSPSGYPTHAYSDRSVVRSDGAAMVREGDEGCEVWMTADDLDAAMEARD